MLRKAIALILILTPLLVIGAAHAEHVEEDGGESEHFGSTSVESYWNPPTGLPSRNTDWTFRRARELLRLTDYRGVPLAMVSRKQWNARPITEPYEPMGDIKGIVIHQSETPEDTTVRSIQYYHQQVKGWTDVGYHYLIAQFPDASGNLEWRIFEGRPLSVKGAHAGRRDGEDLNPGQIGICLMGDFDQPGSRPNPTQQSPTQQSYDPQKPAHLLQADPRAVYLLGLLMNRLMNTYGSQIKEIMGHGAGDHAIWPGRKSCPGQGSYHFVEALRSRYGMDSVDRTR